MPTEVIETGFAWRKLAFKAMGGPCDLRVYSRTDEPVQAVVADIQRLEKKYSRFIDDSITSRINRGAGTGSIDLDRETALLLRYADDAWKISDGLFDITSGVLRAAWNFREQRLPSPGAVEALLPRVGWHRVHFDGERLELPASMEIDFGGIVKEYAADRAAFLLRQHGVSHGLVELAGDIAVTGPLPDGSPWEVRIRHPRHEGEHAGVLHLSSGGVATSGDYERCILIDGERYSHILNPRDGWPVKGLASVTIAHDSCMVAGTLATIAMLKGSRGESWLDAQGVDSICIPARSRAAGTAAG